MPLKTTINHKAAHHDSKDISNVPDLKMMLMDQIVKIGPIINKKTNNKNVDNTTNPCAVFLFISIP
jgi:hypothetical protein